MIEVKTEAHAIADALFKQNFIRSDEFGPDYDEVVELIKKVQEEDPPHWLIYFMATDELGSMVYDTAQACQDDCETDMIPVPVYGIPWPDPESAGEEVPDSTDLEQ